MKRLLLLLSLLSCVTVLGEDMRNAPLDLSPAKWIWYPCGRTLQNTFVQFRKEFTLESAPAEAGGWILADSRYRLYVNGRRVQFGPAPCDPRWQEADPVNLAPYLTQGRNAIAVEVCFFGTGDGTTPFGKPGLIMKLDVDGREIVTDKSWACLLSRSWTPGQYKRAYLRSLQESFDARLYPYGWDEAGFEQDSSWVAAAEISEGGNKPSVCTSGKDYLWG
ncbi:MAG: alpha-L-rhamnosidase N-terminal domain-containing protein, partial [Bacteroidales bacterium]|nr:alpha-L-rhamnosidase N-terminal domain-containing protein [Candidatus Cacconaster equifaecalis]